VLCFFLLIFHQTSVNIKQFSRGCRVGLCPPFFLPVLKRVGMIRQSDISGFSVLIGHLLFKVFYYGEKRIDILDKVY